MILPGKKVKNDTSRETIYAAIQKMGTQEVIVRSALKKANIPYNRQEDVRQEILADWLSRFYDKKFSQGEMASYASSMAFHTCLRFKREMCVPARLPGSAFRKDPEDNNLLQPGNLLEGVPWEKVDESLASDAFSKDELKRFISIPPDEINYDMIDLLQCKEALESEIEEKSEETSKSDGKIKLNGKKDNQSKLLDVAALISERQALLLDDTGDLNGKKPRSLTKEMRFFINNNQASKRQKEILNYFLEGYSIDEVVDFLGIQKSSLTRNLRNIASKLNGLKENLKEIGSA